MSKKEELKGMEASPLNVGETIDFDRVLKSNVETRFGMGTVVRFIKDRKIVRATWAGSGLLAFLEQNPTTKKITLVDKVADGEMTYNIYE